MARYRVETGSTGYEYVGLTLAEAAIRMDDLTGCGERTILDDWAEDCERCGGTGRRPFTGARTGAACKTCHGDGKRSEAWEWTDEETGREVTMTKEDR